MAHFELKPECVEELLNICERVKTLERLLDNGIFVTIEEVRVILNINKKEKENETVRACE